MRRLASLVLAIVVGVGIPLAGAMSAPSAIAAASEPDASPAIAPEPAAATPTTTWISGGSTTGTVGYQQNFSIGVTPTTDGGTVSLTVDGITVASYEMSPGGTGAMLGWAPTSTGEHTVLAAFGGTASFAASSSAPWTVTVFNPPPYSVDVTASVNPIPRTADVTFTAAVSPDPGPSSIEWSVNGVPSGTTPIAAGGAASWTTSFATVGTRTVRATFTGNASWSPRFTDYVAYVVGDVPGLTVTVPPAPIPAGPVAATATLSQDPGGGTISWKWEPWEPWGHATPVGPGGVTSLDLGTLSAGYRHLYVMFSGYDQWAARDADVAFEVLQPSSTTIATNRATATAGELPVVLTATLTLPDGAAAAAVTFVDDVAGSVVEFGPFPVDQYTKQATFSSSLLRVGTHVIRARFDGVQGVMGSSSDPVTVTVAKDLAVHGTFTASRSSFYPYKDGLWDTVSLGGTLDERATVTIRVYSSTGSLKRAFPLGWKGPGRYYATWNGRTATGVALPAGKYRVTATFKDARNNVRTITAYTTVSWRQATWKSVTVVRYGDQLAYYGDLGDMGQVYGSADYSRGVIMDAGPMVRDCTGCGFVFGQATFGLSSSGLAYRYVNIAIQGHGFVEREHPGTSYLVNPVTGAWVMTNSLPEYLNSGYNVPVGAGYISSARQVKLILFCTQAWGDAFDLHYLKLTYQYAVWR